LRRHAGFDVLLDVTLEVKLQLFIEIVVELVFAGQCAPAPP